jgi:hypothetical protein
VTEGQGTRASELSLPLVEVTTEPVDFEGMRVRPTGSVAAAVADEELQIRNVGGRSDPSHVSNRPKYHPGTRVRVDATLRLGARFLRSKPGVALARRVLADLRNQGYWPFRNCYEDAAREQPDPGGKAELRLILRSDGAVFLTRLLKTDVRNRSIAACFAEAARRLRLTPTRLRRVDVDVVVAVWPGDVALLPLPKPPAYPQAVDLQEMTRVVKSIEPDVVRCIQEARHVDPMLWGRLALAFAPDETGHPSSVREFQSQFGEPSAVACIVARMETLAFPISRQRPVRLTAAWLLHRPPPVEPTSTQPSPTVSPAIDPEVRDTDVEPRR